MKIEYPKPTTSQAAEGWKISVECLCEIEKCIYNNFDDFTLGLEEIECVLIAYQKVEDGEK